MKAAKETDDGLEYYKRQYTESTDLTQDSRTKAETCIDYYDGNQMTREEMAILNKRRQPVVINNRVRIAVNGILGVTAKGKSDPRCWPRTPDDQDSADVATDVLRYVADDNRFSALKLQCFRDMLIPGTMAAIVEVDKDLKVKTNQIRWEEFFYDARSRRNDFGDARFLGIAKWRYIRDVAKEYPEAKTDLEHFMDAGIGNRSFDDRPVAQSWCDKKDGRVLIIELYARESQWMRVCFYGGGILSRDVSPYLDDKGEPTCPIEAQSAYVDRDNGRYGVVVDMLSMQDEVNKRRSKLLHLISNSQVQAVDERAFEADRELARDEAKKADGVIPPGWQRVPTADLASGQVELLNDAYMNMDRMGPNPAILGRQGADSSGRALLARQQAGLVELAIVYDGLDDWELRIFRQIWARVKQFWKAPQYIRVTDDEDAPKHVMINEPQLGPPQPMYQPDGNIGIGQPVLGYKNQIAEMDVDIILDTQPDTANIQQEQFQTLATIVGSNPAYAEKVPFEVMVQISSIPDKRRLLDMLKKSNEESQQGAAQAQQAQQQLLMAQAQADVLKTQSETDLNEARTAELGFKAATDLHQAAQPPKPAAGEKGASQSAA